MVVVLLVLDRLEELLQLGRILDLDAQVEVSKPVVDANDDLVGVGKLWEWRTLVSQAL